MPCASNGYRVVFQRAYERAAKRALVHVFFISSTHQTSNISRTSVGNKIVDHSVVVGAAPTGDALTTSSFST